MDLHALPLHQVSKLFRWEGSSDEPMHKKSKSRGVLHVPAIHSYHIKGNNMLIHEMFTAGKSPAPFISPHDSLVQR
jgi:hypothetical protein